MNIKIAVTIVVLLILGFVGYLFYSQNNTGSDSATFSTPTQKLVVSPQEARTSVLVDSVTLAEGGYVVIRGSDGSRMGQVIEISPYLEAGQHENIEILLGDFYTYNVADQLVAMIYRDDGDKSFSDLDEPSTSEGGVMSAVFVKTGTAVPVSVFSEQVAMGGGMGMETVRYTDMGFQPSKLTVPVGTMVEFINQSGSDMWVASNMHPSHEMLSTFDQFKGVGKNESYMYTFDKKGSWPYHDHINPALEGVIEVK